MLRYRRARAFLFAVQALLGIGAIVGGVAYARWILTVDPLAKFRSGPVEDNRIGMSMENVEFAMFDKDARIGTIRARQMNVTRDRTRIELVDIFDGRIYTDKGEFKFEAARADYEQRRQQVSALKGARIIGKEMDLKVDGFTYSRRGQRLNTVGKVSGLLAGGQFQTSELVYFPEEESFRFGPFEWSGEAKALGSSLPGIQARSVWKVSNLDESKSPPSTYKNGILTTFNARATDGEVIVKADKVEVDRRTDVLTATGNVRYFSERTNMVCEKVVVYRKEKRAVLTGNVTMLIKPKDQEKLEEAPIPPFRPVVPASISGGRPPAPTSEDKKQDEEVRGDNLRKFPTQVWAEQIVYWYGEGSKRAEITGKPQARQDLPNGRWRHIWTKEAFYNGQAETLKLVSTPGTKDTRVKTSVGDDLVAKWFLFSTKESDEDEWEAEGIEGDIVSDDDDLNNRNNPPPATNPPTLRGRIGG
jgi:hypothetical protein